MNNKVFIFLVLFSISMTISAQVKREKIVYEEDKNETVLGNSISDGTSLYFLAGLGFNVGVNSYKNKIYNDANFTSTDASYGNGIATQLGIGYTFNKNWSIECDFDLNIGVNNTYSPESYDFIDNSTSSPVDVTETAEFKFSSDLYKITPSIVWTFDTKTKVKPYLKAGVIFGFSNRYEIHQYTDEYPNSNYYSDVLKLKYYDTGGNGVGLALAFGIKKAILENKFYLFGELNYQNLDQTYKKGNMIAATINDQDYLSFVSVADKDYSYNSNPKNTGNPNVKSERIIEKYNFDSIGLKIGLIYMLN